MIPVCSVSRLVNSDVLAVTFHHIIIQLETHQMMGDVREVHS